MPVLIDTVGHMQEHVKNFFPFDDLPQIFGLHKSATSKATSDQAAEIMGRIYRHQFVIKKTTVQAQMSRDSSNKQTQAIYEFYR